jgi:cytochrome-b5 reductase
LITPRNWARSTTQQQPRFRRRIIWLYRIIWLLGIGYATTAYTLPPSPSGNHPVFSRPRFTPFTIIDREDVSPTGFILTVRPRKSTPPTSDPYADSWAQGTWSVEFKQPQLQIARSYTPLPPRPDLPPPDLRFLIRRETGGEVSNYLANLPPQATVELRGAHPGVDLPRGITDVVFLAGGTGIAPAMQVAHTLLENRTGGERPSIHILWANRKRDDCVERGAAGTVVRELQEMQQRFPENLRVEYLVDEEGTFLDQKRISVVTQRARGGSAGAGVDPKLLFVSGPEGFVNFLAGPKRWEDGEEKQGNVGGVIKRMGLKGWKVWKL